MFDKMKQLMEMKKQAEQIKRDLDTLEVESDEVKGISIKLNGSQDFRLITIDEEFLASGKKQELETALLRSVNAAIKKSQSVAANKMRDVMPGLGGI